MIDSSVAPGNYSATIHLTEETEEKLSREYLLVIEIFDPVGEEIGQILMNQTKDSNSTTNLTIPLTVNTTFDGPSPVPSIKSLSSFGDLSI